jgi:glycosyltransferase involved in cell wall biosynthesis
VVVCTHDRPEALDACLRFASALRYPDVRLLVVDSASRDGRTREVAASWHATYLRSEVAGLSHARNLGARACTTEILAFTDDDAVIEPDWLINLTAGFCDPNVMAVTGRVRPLVAAAPLDETDARDDSIAVDRNTPSWFELASFGGVGSGGANMAFRRRAFDVWPGFDERLGRGTPINGGEESYAFFSLIDRGYRVVYAPGAIVRHEFPRTIEALRRRRLQDLGPAAAYLLFLFVEEPAYRWTIAKFVGRALRRRASGARPVTEPHGVSRVAVIAALLHGVRLFFKAARRSPMRAGSGGTPLGTSPAAPSSTAPTTASSTTPAARPGQRGSGQG